MDPRHTRVLVVFVGNGDGDAINDLTAIIAVSEIIGIEGFSPATRATFSALNFLDDDFLEDFLDLDLDEADDDDDDDAPKKDVSDLCPAM